MTERIYRIASTEPEMVFMIVHDIRNGAWRVKKTRGTMINCTASMGSSVSEIRQRIQCSKKLQAMVDKIVTAGCDVDKLEELIDVPRDRFYDIENSEYSVRYSARRCNELMGEIKEKYFDGHIEGISSKGL